MSAIAGMNPSSLCNQNSGMPHNSLNSVPSVVRQQQIQSIPITTTSPPPFLIQGHRLPGSPPPGLQNLPLPESPMQTENYNEKYSPSGSVDMNQTQHPQPEPDQLPLVPQVPQHQIQLPPEEVNADPHNLFENNANQENQDRAESPAKDATLEPESDDELFINEGPSLDDDDDDSFQETSGGFPQDNFDDSSTFIDEEDTTYGSPGLREAFSEGFSANHDQESLLDQEPSRAGSADNSRKNKRKQFRPRNIVYSVNDESDNDDGAQVHDQENPAVNLYNRRNHISQSERENSPMDLSVPPRPDLESDSESESSQAATDQSKPKPGGLSVVRPEILFGDNKVPSSSASNNSSASDPSPLSLLSNLSGFPQGLNPLSHLKPEEDATGNSMKDAFKEVLKLYGFSSDTMENIMQNACTDQGQEKQIGGENPFPLSGAMHPGMLSAALQGNLPPSHQPPTPPRTPQGHQKQYEENRSSQGISMVPKMPSLLAMAGLQQQMLSKPGIPPLPAHMNKQSLQGLPPGMLGVHPMAGLPPSHGMPPIPSHLLAAQRVHGLMPGKPIVTTDYTRYFKRFGSSLECGFAACKDMNYREHFHCAVPMCKGKDFAKKEEMIRHSKWHQKMDEALKYGFRRVTPMDDCSDQFQDCSHNKKQTHYHCIQSDGCDKVYISTSDVQMHFNYHRKDNAIQREGFLRFRGAEDCHTSHCLYRGQRTTHFHCNRSSCQYTFKNKADMEKHKNYHMKDEQLNKDGFKKFMKHEPCGFLSCKFSRTHNHIHCIRNHCEYVLHSSGQLFSHKRKHERKDNELAYRKYKLAQSMMNPGSGQNGLFPFPNPASSPDISISHQNENSNSLERPPSSNGSLTSGSSSPPLNIPPTSMGLPRSEPNGQMRFSPMSMPQSFSSNAHGAIMSMAQPLPPTSNYGNDIKREPLPFMQLPQVIPEDVWQNYLLRFEQEEGCGFQECDVEDTEHFHCKDEGCETVFRTEEGVREHGRNHFQQDCISETYFAKVDPEEPGTEAACPAQCPYKNKEIHFHCKWDNCAEVILSTDVPFRRLDHYKIHEYTKKWNMSQKGHEPVSMTMTTNIDTMFKRKRGRPPKNRVIEVFDKHFGGSSASPGTPQAVFTSFKLPKPGPPMPPDFPGLQGPVSSHSPYSFSVAPIRPPIPQFTTTTQFDMKTEPGQNITSESAINLGPNSIQEAKKELCENPTAPVSQEDIQKIQENNNNNQSENESSSEEVTPPKNQGLIKARGTYFPLTAFPTSMPQGPIMRRDSTPPGSERPVQTEETSPPISMKSKIGVNFMVSVGRNMEQGDNALAKLLQASQEMGFANSDRLESNPNKQLSDERKLQPTIPDLSPISSQARDSLHSQMGSPVRRETPSPQIILSPSQQSPRMIQSSSPISVPTSPVISSGSLTPTSSQLSFANPFGIAGRPFLSSPGMLPPGMNPFFPHAGMIIPGVPNPFQRFPNDPRMTAGLFDPSKPFPRPGWPGGLGGPALSQKRSSPMELDDDIGMSLDQKKLRLQSSMRMLKDEPVPEGYMRFRFNEDCQFSNCNYREHQTHFHCMRKDCNYRFCDKTRFVQHTARHERLDTLCGDEFQGFRGVACGREDCELNVLHNTSANQKSSSHFHCLKCDYYCTDTNKVVAHRRQHQKLDSIMAAGFEKYTPTQYCATPGCTHNGKQTHYHCRKCQYAVLGLSQMEAHKYRHLNE